MKLHLANGTIAEGSPDELAFFVGVLESDDAPTSLPKLEECVNWREHSSVNKGKALAEVYISSSKGPVYIHAMHSDHLANAVLKLVRDGDAGLRCDELKAMVVEMQMRLRDHEDR